MPQLKTRLPGIKRGPGLSRPACYQVKVQGWLGTGWEDWFDGLAITTEKMGGEMPVTVLTGKVADQAALYGLLQKLYRLGLPLLSLVCLELHHPGHTES